MSESALYALHLGKVEVPPKLQNNPSLTEAKPSSSSLPFSNAETCDGRDHLDPVACAFHLFSDFDTPAPTLQQRVSSVVQPRQAHRPQNTAKPKQEWNFYSEYTV